MRKYRWKKIWISPKNYVIVRLYHKKRDMQDFFRKDRPENKLHYRTLGANLPYETHIKKKGTKHFVIDKKIGTVLLCKEHCSASIVAHEFMHAVFWGYKFKKNKAQYPIEINSMKDEEVILYRLTYALTAFYNWFYSIK